MLKRKITNQLLNWKNKQNRFPLILKGLRQIGKTFIVKEFAKNNYENAFILDFRKQRSLHAIFDGDFNINEFMISISSLPTENHVIPNSQMISFKTLLIFDEIQDCPNARSSLKYFKEDGRFDVICTGSLLGVDGYRVSKKPSRGIAVGFEEQVNMYPLDFEEFMWALNIEDSVIDTLKDCVNKRKEIPAFIHSNFLDLIRKYICVGGMPEVVNAFIDTHDMSEVRKIQNKLISGYKSDFGTHLNDSFEIKVDATEKARLLDVFDSIPKQLAKDNKKFQYSVIGKGIKARTHEQAIKWLKNYGLIDTCHNLSTVEEPFDFFAVKDCYKVYMSDIGLLVGMLDKDVPFKILSNDLGIGKGMIYENLVAETFHKLQKPMYYFGKDSGLEIDFVSNLFDKTYLIEAKAKNGNTKSSNAVLSNPKYKVDNLLKLTSQNIGFIDNKFTVPYYLSFYVLNK